MKYKITIIVSVIVLFTSRCLGQTGQLTVAEDFKPAVTNQPGKQFPQVTGEISSHKRNEAYEN